MKRSGKDGSVKKARLFPAISNAPAGDIAELETHINQFNVSTTAIVDDRDLTIILRTPDGRIYAGLHGFTWGGYCEVKLLWVAPARRSGGIGSALLASAEHEAKKRGCGRMILTTHSFQAPEFYQRHGFRRVAEVADCPAGHSHISLMKDL